MFGQKNKKAEKEAEVDLNKVVTPMLDMTFQILFFLIMNFRLPTPEGQVDLLLPKEDTGEPTMAAEDLLDETKEEFRIRVYIVRGQGESFGNISRMAWRQTKPKKQPEEGVAIEEPPNSESDEYYRKLDPVLYGLVVKLREHKPKDDDAKKQPTITVECEPKLRYSEVLRIMDILRKLKFKNVGVKPMGKPDT